MIKTTVAAWRPMRIHINRSPKSLSSEPPIPIDNKPKPSADMVASNASIIIILSIMFLSHFSSKKYYAMTVSLKPSC